MQRSEKVQAIYGGMVNRAKQAQNREYTCSCCCGDQYFDEDLCGVPADSQNCALGCGNPVSKLDLQGGETVVDLGSGGGLDSFIAARKLGGGGQVYGVDMTDAMLELAQTSCAEMGLSNVAFVKGNIESIPLDDEMADVVVSNCVLCLCDNTENALREAYRILKPGGRFLVSDCIRLKEMDGEVLECADEIVGVGRHSYTQDEYRDVLCSIGFGDIRIEGNKTYTLAQLEMWADAGEIGDWRSDAELGAKFDTVGEQLIDNAYGCAYISAVKG